MPDHYEAIFLKVPLNTFTGEVSMNELHQLEPLTRILEPELRDYHAEVVGMTSVVVYEKFVLYTVILKKRTQGI